MSARNVSLNALRAFDAAARRRSFTAAADELHVTQAAVSQQIRTLEEQLGAKLFLREPRGLRLTALGEDLAGATRDALALVEASIERIAGTAETSVLTVSTLPSFASRWLVPRLGRFQARHPDIELRVHASSEVVDLLGTPVDAAIRFGPAGGSGLVVAARMPDALCLVAAPALAARIGDDADRLHDHPLAIDDAALLRVASSRTTATATEHAIDALGLDRMRLRRRVFSTSDNVVQSALVGDATALTRLSLVLDDVEAGRLVTLLGFALPLEHGTSLVHAESRRRDPKLVALRAWLEEEAEAFNARMSSRLADGAASGGAA